MKSKYKIMILIVLCIFVLFNIIKLYESNKVMRMYVVNDIKKTMAQLEYTAKNGKYITTEYIDRGTLTYTDIHSLNKHNEEIRSYLISILNALDTLKTESYVNANIPSKNILAYYEISAVLNSFRNKTDIVLDKVDLQSLSDIRKVYEEYILIADEIIIRMDRYEEWIPSFNKFFSVSMYP